MDYSPWGRKQLDTTEQLSLSQVAQWLRICLPGQEMQVQSLGQEDPLEEERAIHSALLAWKIPWTEEPGRSYGPWGHRESDTTETTEPALEILRK